MKKILGLDIGTNSIGIAVLKEAENTNERSEILLLASRIIPTKPEDNSLSEFSEGKPITKNRVRGEDRGRRRNFARLKLRKKTLIKDLIDMSLWKSSDISIGNYKQEYPNIKTSVLEIFRVRSEASIHKIDIADFGKLGLVFYNLLKKRGYAGDRNSAEETKTKSVVEDDTDTKKNAKISKKKKDEGKSYLEKIDSAEKALIDIEGNRVKTVGTYFYEKIKLNPHTNTKNRMDEDEHIFLRKSYESEFKQIWDCQAQYYPTIFTTERYNTIGKKNIFYQRPLKSQKHLLSTCEFEYYTAKINDVVKKIGVKVSPKSSPIFQLFRIYQEVNNIEIVFLSKPNSKFIF